MRNALAMILVGALLVACGQRGPLYLPGEEREEVDPGAPAATPANAPAAAPAASPLPPTAPSPTESSPGAPSPAATAGTTTDDNETTRRNRAN
jgi:predicted small lipoprotein YifL